MSPPGVAPLLPAWLLTSTGALAGRQVSEMVEFKVPALGLVGLRVRAISSTSPRATTRHPGGRLGRIG